MEGIGPFDLDIGWVTEGVDDAGGISGDSDMGSSEERSLGPDI